MIFRGDLRWYDYAALGLVAAVCMFTFFCAGVANTNLCPKVSKITIDLAIAIHLVTTGLIMMLYFFFSEIKDTVIGKQMFFSEFAMAILKCAGWGLRGALFGALLGVLSFVCIAFFGLMMGSLFRALFL